MTDTAATQTLIALAAKRFGRNANDIRADHDLFETLNIDSYQAMELLTEVEEHFGVEIPDYEMRSVRTFASLATVIEKRL